MAVPKLTLTRWPFHIEHPTRGVFRDMEGDPDRPLGVFRFSWSGGRNDMGKCWRFQTLAAASEIYWQVPEHIRKDCKILYWSNHRQQFDPITPIPEG